MLKLKKLIPFLHEVALNIKMRIVSAIISDRQFLRAALQIIGIKRINLVSFQNFSQHW
ncbi:hypothetical protein [Okeania sp. KiyG1]|uniref:hypothetical protein n=1 Tax=Okeania sp. KiyG1 TaxID=2720165 RepID=UPI0019209564|nr:hypothetical protein [Okeania sp. KiyG1]